MTEEHENEAAASDVVAADLVINNDRSSPSLEVARCGLKGKLLQLLESLRRRRREGRSDWRLAAFLRRATPPPP